MEIKRLYNSSIEVSKEETKTTKVAYSKHTLLRDRDLKYLQIQEMQRQLAEIDKFLEKIDAMEVDDVATIND